MTQKVDPRNIKIPDSSDGYILRITGNGKSGFDQIISGSGTLDSNLLISNFEDYINNLESSLLPDSSGREIDIGRDSLRIDQIFIEDSISLGSSHFSENGLIEVNGVPVRLVDSTNITNTITSAYVEQRSDTANVQGPQGVTGLKGPIGAQGVKGISLQGPCGLQGIPGIAGPPREQAVQGIQGLQGPDGFNGGGSGLDGPRGLQGCKGITGERGDKGTRGIAGQDGVNSVQGARGSQGPQGLCGYPGSDGTAGSQGVCGFQGFQGTIVGRRGLCGICGCDGSVQGAKGIQGPRGFDGTQTGPGCIQGVRGVQGTENTTQGVQGIDGAGSNLAGYCLSCLGDACTQGASIFLGCLSWEGNGTNKLCSFSAGYRADYITTSGLSCNNISIGFCTTRSTSTSTLSNNVSIGHCAGLDANRAVSIGFCANGGLSNGVAIGASSGCNNTCQNVDIGFCAQSRSCTCRSVSIGACIRNCGSNNVIIGALAVTQGPSSDGRNVFIGFSTPGRPGTSATNRHYENVAVGSFNQSLCCIGSSIRNTSVGNNALFFFGYSGCTVTCFECNTAIGSYAGRGIKAPASLTTFKNVMFIGAYSLRCIPSYNNAIYLGPSTTCAIRSNQTTITSLSDCRDKTDIQPISYGLDFINQMNPVSFYWNERDSDGRVDEPDIGFIAQDFKSLESDQGSAEFTRLVEGDDNKYYANPMRTYPIAIKAIQELKNQINRLKEDFQSLKNEV